MTPPRPVCSPAPPTLGPTLKIALVHASSIVLTTHSVKIILGSVWRTAPSGVPSLITPPPSASPPVLRTHSQTIAPCDAWLDALQVPSLTTPPGAALSAVPPIPPSTVIPTAQSAS